MANVDPCRFEALLFGISANKAEGLDVSDFFLGLAERYLRGEIDLDDFHDLLDVHYYGRPGVSNELSSCVYSF